MKGKKIREWQFTLVIFVYTNTRQMVKLESNEVSVSISQAGAELNSIFHKHYGLEYMWNGDADFWGKHSPVLFPVVGALKENKYYFNYESYILPRHGFARDRKFEVIDQQNNSATFRLGSDDTTRAVYPFEFELLITYTVNNNLLHVNYKVNNPGNETMYFSLGAHPAFAVPLEKGASYEDYYLEFNMPEDAGRWPISADGLIEAHPREFFNGERKIPLRKELFYQDALVFKGLNSNRISIKTDLNQHGLEFEFNGFPFFGIWAAKDANFVCLEPWCGIADNVLTDQKLVYKEGINELAAGETFERNWSVKVY